MSKEAEQTITFEQKIQRIQKIVDILNESDIPMEEMFDLYQEGMKLASECRNVISAAENKIIDITNKYAAAESNEYTDGSL
jgi:exodeoxyribonuclease VII small subunit